MLHPVVWLSVYILVLFGLGRAVRDWRDRGWFKLVFFPGAMLAALPQVVASVLCLGSPCKVSFFADRRPTFSVDTSRVPALAGALFVLVSHLLFYLLFLVGVTRLEAAGYLNARLVVLPAFYPEQVLEGHIELNLRSYLAGLGALWSYALARPLPILVTLYLSAGAFSCLRLRGPECRWGVIVLLVLGGILFLAEKFGVGFPLWANIFYVPRWWSLFSFYFTMALLSLGAFAAARLLLLALKTAFHRDGRGPADPAKNRPARVEFTA